MRTMMRFGWLATALWASAGCSSDDSTSGALTMNSADSAAGGGGSAMVPGVAGAGGGTSTGSSRISGGPAPTVLPEPKGACEPFKTGDMMFGGQMVKIWAGAPAHGPLVLYWYATGSSVAEVTRGLGQAAIDEITAEGGVVAAMYKTTALGSTTNNYVWYTGDFDITDEVVACAVAVQHIDTARIHAIGFSAGGLQSGYMAYARSNYIASAVTYSGGSFTTTLQDPGNVPRVMCQHGDPGVDVVIIDFSTFSANLETDIKTKGGFAIDCHHPGGHLIPSADVPSSWQFMKDHPYKISPEPYADGIPSSFPAYCTIP